MKPQDSSSAQHQKLSTQEIVELVKQVSGVGEAKEKAISRIIKEGKNIPNISTILWYSSGTSVSILGDLLSFYPSLGVAISKADSQKIIEVLQLVYIIAKDTETKLPFVRSNFPIYLFPFIQRSIKLTETYHIAAAVLAIFAALVQESNPEIIKYLINADFLPIIRKVLGLQNIQMRTVAAFILLKILNDTDGRLSLLSNVDNITIIMKILCHSFVQLSTNYVTELADYIIDSLSIVLAFPEVKRVFIYVIGDSLSSIETPSKYGPRYHDLFSKMKSIIANYNQK
jgi:hypothetical protein